MKPKTPELLLILYILLPVKSAMVAQVLLCQVKAIHASRQAEKTLGIDLDNNTDEAFRQFLISFWFKPDNASTYAYLGFLARHLGLVNNPIIEIHNKISNNKFEYSKSGD